MTVGESRSQLDLVRKSCEANKKLLGNREIVYAPAPKVRVVWIDACSSEKGMLNSNEKIDTYVGGVIDEITGFFLGVTDNNFVIIGTSAYVREDGTTGYRGLWDIPVGWIVDISELMTFSVFSLTGSGTATITDWTKPAITLGPSSHGIANTAGNKV